MSSKEGTGQHQVNGWINKQNNTVNFTLPLPSPLPCKLIEQAARPIPKTAKSTTLCQRPHGVKKLENVVREHYKYEISVSIIEKADQKWPRRGSSRSGARWDHVGPFP